LSTIEISGKTSIDVHTATKVLRMAEKFFSDPKNIKGFEEWHLKEYGFLPNEDKTNKKNIKKRDKNSHIERNRKVLI